jgi:hypothetical protein
MSIVYGVNVILVSIVGTSDDHDGTTKLNSIIYLSYIPYTYYTQTRDRARVPSPSAKDEPNCTPYSPRHTPACTHILQALTARRCTTSRVRPRRPLGPRCAATRARPTGHPHINCVCIRSSRAHHSGITCRHACRAQEGRPRCHRSTRRSLGPRIRAFECSRSARRP